LCPSLGAGRKMETRRSARRVSVFPSGARGTFALTILHPALGSGAVRLAVPFGLLGLFPEGLLATADELFRLVRSLPTQEFQRLCFQLVSGHKKFFKFLLDLR
jgi:hypothetical protein